MTYTLETRLAQSPQKKRKKRINDTFAHLWGLVVAMLVEIEGIITQLPE